MDQMTSRGPFQLYVFIILKLDREAFSDKPYPVNSALYHVSLPTPKLHAMLFSLFVPCFADACLAHALQLSCSTAEDAVRAHRRYWRRMACSRDREKMASRAGSPCLERQSDLF